MVTPSPRARGIRAKLYRNRQISFARHEVTTDGRGNIIDRPLTINLPCFADPIERLFGRFDTPRIWGEKEPEPRGCAMCRVWLPCGQVVWERLEKTPVVRKRYYEWEKATSNLREKDRYDHPTWRALVVLCEETKWADTNDRKLEELEEARQAARIAEKEAKAAARERRLKSKPRSVPKHIKIKVQAYRNERIQEMQAAKLDPKAPLWLRNRSAERCILIADAWQAREILTMGRRKTSATAIEPPRDCRRPFGLSYAAMGVSSSMA